MFRDLLNISRIHLSIVSEVWLWNSFDYPVGRHDGIPTFALPKECVGWWTETRKNRFEVYLSAPGQYNPSAWGCSILFNHTFAFCEVWEDHCKKMSRSKRNTAEPGGVALLCKDEVISAVSGLHWPCLLSIVLWFTRMLKRWLQEISEVMFYGGFFLSHSSRGAVCRSARRAATMWRGFSLRIWAWTGNMWGG